MFDRFNKLLSSPDRRPELGSHAGEPTVIYDVRGRVVAMLSTDQIPLEEVADPMWQVTTPPPLPAWNRTTRNERVRHLNTGVFQW